MPSAFPRVVHECRDPRASIAIGKLPALMRRHGFGRYAVLEVPTVGRRRYVATVTFSDPEADQIERSPHSCPQCQAGGAPNARRNVVNPTGSRCCAAGMTPRPEFLT